MNSFPQQGLKNLVIPPRLQLTLRVLPPEPSNCDLVGSCDEPGHRHFRFLGHFQLLLKKIPDLFHKRWSILPGLLRSVFQPWCQEWPPASFLCQSIHHRLQLLLGRGYVLTFIARSSRLTGGACDSKFHALKPQAGRQVSYYWMIVPYNRTELELSGELDISSKRTSSNTMRISANS